MTNKNPYRLYRDETECDSDDWGPPVGEFSTLAEAVTASGIPLKDWQAPDPKWCPDEVNVDTDGHCWSVLGPAAAKEIGPLKALASAG